MEGEIIVYGPPLHPEELLSSGIPVGLRMVKWQKTQETARKYFSNLIR